VANGEWRSLVARLLWEQEAGSSNLPSPTIIAVVFIGFFQCV
jgi:hypothetical protein